MIDLWPGNIPSHSIIRTPVAILKEQASLLGDKTKNIVEAKVRASEGLELPDGHFRYRFNILAPCLGSYTYHLFVIVHPIDFYPVTFEAGFAVVEDMAKNGSCEIDDVKLIAETEEQFMDILKAILATDKTRQVVEAILAQSVV